MDNFLDSRQFKAPLALPLGELSPQVTEGALGAKGNKPSLTVGNGLCAVPHVEERNCLRKKPAPQSPVQELPLRGSWQGAALTDEGAGQREIL